MSLRKAAILAVVAVAIAGAAFLMRAGASPRIYPKSDGIALVNRQSITKDEFREYLGSSLTHKHAAAAFRNVGDLEESLDQYIETVLIMQDARERGVFEREEFLSAVQIGEDALLARKFRLTKLEEIIPVDEEDMRPYIPREWVRIRFRQIVLRDKEEAKAVLGKARSGADFIELVREHSIGPAAGRDGDLGFIFPDSEFFSPADDVYLFTLDVGAVSDVVQTPLGPAICKIEEKKALTEAEIAEQTERPRAVLFNAKVQRHIHDIKEKTGVELYPDTLYDCVKAMHDGDKQDGLIGVAGDEKFTFNDLQRTLARPHDQVYLDPTVDMLFELYRQDLDSRISAYLLAQEAQMFGVEVETEAEKRHVKKFTEMVVFRVLGEELFAGISASEDETREYFRDNADEFNIPERVDFWQILLATRDDAELILNKLEAGESFKKLAHTYSTDERSSRLSGFVGTLQKRDFVDELAETVFSISTGAYSDIIETEFGYHIIMITRKTPGKKYEYDQIRGKVKKAVLRKKQEDEFGQYVLELREKAAIDVSDDALNDVFAELRKRSAPSMN